MGNFTYSTDRSWHCELSNTKCERLILLRFTAEIRRAKRFQSGCRAWTDRCLPQNREIARAQDTFCGESRLSDQTAKRHDRENRSAFPRSCRDLRLAIVTPYSDDALRTIILWQRTWLNLAFTP